MMHNSKLQLRRRAKLLLLSLISSGAVMAATLVMMDAVRPFAALPLSA
jgi:hypothetical protein